MLLLFLYLILNEQVSTARNFSLNPPADSIFELIYNRDFPVAEQLLLKSKLKLDPLNYELLYLDLHWWKSIKAIKVEDFTDFRHKLASLEQISSSENKTEILLQELIRTSYLIRMSAHENRYFTVISQLNHINSLIEKLEKRDLPPPQRELFDIYKAIVQILKSKITFSRSLRNNALAVLKKYTSSSNLISSTIANYFTGKVYYEIEDNPETALPFFRKLTELFPENIIFGEYVKRCSQKK